jgi:hypothetical protein
VNRIAAEKAIDRQRAALDAVNYDRAVGVQLRSLIVNPKQARPPVPVAEERNTADSLDFDKRFALARALVWKTFLRSRDPQALGRPGSLKR